MEKRELLQKIHRALEELTEALSAAGADQLDACLAAMAKALEGLEKTELLLEMGGDLRDFALTEQKKHLKDLNDEAKRAVMHAYSLPKTVFQQAAELHELLRQWPAEEPRQAPPAKKHYCRFCGGEVAPGTVFCHRCGSRVDISSRPQTPVAPVKPAYSVPQGRCPTCGGAVSSQERFCHICGCAIPQGEKAAPATADKSVFCFHCGSAIPADVRFCPRCGSSNQGAESRFPVPPAPMAPSMASPAPMPPRPSAPAPMPSMAPAAAPAPKKKESFFGKLFGGKSKEPVREAPPAPVQADDVQFRGAAPQSIEPGEYFTVKIMMYREDDTDRADRESASVAQKVKTASSGVFRAQRDQLFRIVLQSPEIDIEDNSADLRWNGKFASADFEVLLPEGFDKKQLRLRGRVYSGDAALTDLKLILQVRADRPQEVLCEKTVLRSAFISYASADRAQVVARIQGIQLARPDIDLFFDVESLRRGEAWEPRLFEEIEKRDLFYLFWSANAARSEWVAKELGYALAKKTVDYIEPIPLQAPDVCPPPQALTGKHFNDWTLRYLNQ